MHHPLVPSALLLALFSVDLSLSSVALLPKCGQAYRRVRRVEGGAFALANDYPWMVSIQWSFNGADFEHQCGGSLITLQAVLTAAHCRSLFERVAREGGKMRVVVGCNDHRNPDHRCHAQEISLKDWINHELYYDHWKNFKHDIAVILLQSNVTGPTGIPATPICLPPYRTADHIGICSVAGWGYSSPFLEVADVRSLPPYMCSNYKSAFVHNNMICAGDVKGVSDACQGDSGSPLMVHQEATFYQTGIVSGGRGCALREWNGIYTKVSRYIRWIEEQTQDHGKLQHISRDTSVQSKWPLQRRQRRTVSRTLLCHA